MAETTEYQPLHAPSSSGSFRSNVWDPALITSQIGAIQMIYYTSSTTLLLIGSRVIGFPISLTYLFDPEFLMLENNTGRWLGFVYFLNALALAFAMSLLVRRSKLCLDFVVTCAIFHLVISWLFTAQFPVSPSWWAVNIMAGIVATLLGEYLCLRGEMEAIPVNQTPRADV